MELETIILLTAPLVIAELVMKVIALLNLRKQERTRGPKLMWVLLILFVNTIGWIVYFLAGREDR